MDLMSASRSRSADQLPSAAAWVLTTSETEPSGAYSAIPTVACSPVQPLPETVKDVLVLAETKVFSWVILKLLLEVVSLEPLGLALGEPLGLGALSEGLGLLVVLGLLGALGLLWLLGALGLLVALGLLGLFRLELFARAGEAMREAPVIAATALAAARGRPRRMCPPRSTGNDGCRRPDSSPARYLP